MLGASGLEKLALESNLPFFFKKEGNGGFCPRPKSTSLIWSITYGWFWWTPWNIEEDGLEEEGKTDPLVVLVVSEL